ncbi:Sister chromatid cohesion 1 protein 1 [Camellia lanceoleosa]|uniref:Sister chromatid cohesion 1 protein 1 n=1 Tax=Camellia lanceoleosa TaxID=1840588 RepID=A0ACC0H925_9ERIC|nr:Sister chromatid cohesion 1 protein 1 [Camellia lanceoleosa]
MRAKINRKKLNEFDIVKICEEIQNPSVPRALRLDGILMGGVVIVYERKVKLLYDDVNRFLVKLNEALKLKSQLDNVDEPYINNNNPGEKDQSEQYHQADAANITLFDSYQTDTRPYHHFERFDIEGDNETQLNFNSQEDTQIPIPSPPRPAGPQKPDEILDQHPEDQVNQQSNKQKEAIQPQQDHQRQGPTRRKARRPAACAMDYEQTIISGHIYRSWLENTSDIVRRRGRPRKICDPMSTMEIGKLMELSPVALIDGLYTTGNGEIYFPATLLELSGRSTIPTRDLPSSQRRKSPPQPPEPSSSSPPDRAHYTDPLGFPFEDFHSGLGSQSRGKLWANLETHEIPTEVFIPGLSNNLGNNGVRVNEANVMVMPGNSDLLVETGPTQTQQPIFNPPIDLITDSIQMQLKTHFDTPGTSQTESLNELACGLNKKNAAHLFYQTCVLASRDVIRVEQEVPYGDILISRGLNM